MLRSERTWDGEQEVVATGSPITVQRSSGCGLVGQRRESGKRVTNPWVARWGVEELGRAVPLHGNWSGVGRRTGFCGAVYGIPRIDWNPAMSDEWGGEIG